jgi:lantibiotic biosynthesis dehydratase-like protein
VQFANELQIVPEGAHTPRVTIDDLVVCRETWRFASAELPFVSLHDAAARLLEARRWAARLGLPERLFYKTTQERKPFFLDLASPTSLKAFVKMARASERVSLSEMLPSHEQLWLHDAEGRAYTSELRLVAVDERPWRASGA